MLGLGLHEWELIMVVSLAVGALSAVAVVVSTQIVIKLQRVDARENADAFAQYKVDAGKETAAALERAAEANARSEEAKAGTATAVANAAKANERAASLEHQAAQAKLETERLRAQLAWRILPQPIADALKKSLATKIGQVNIQHVANDTEAQYFAIQMANIFGSAGWQIGMSSVTLSGTIVFGLWVPDNKSPSTKLVRDSLGSAGIEFSPQAFPMGSIVMSSGSDIPGAPILFVGSKPVPQ